MRGNIVASSAAKGIISALVQSLLGQVMNVVRHELDIAREEVSDKIKGLGVGIGVVTFAASLFTVAIVLLVIAGVAALTIIWPLWLSALVAGGSVLLIALIALAIGVSKIKQNRDLRPERAMSAYRSARAYFN